MNPRDSDEPAELLEPFSRIISLAAHMKLKVIETFSRVWPQWATCLTG